MGAVPAEMTWVSTVEALPQNSPEGFFMFCPGRRLCFRARGADSSGCPTRAGVVGRHYRCMLIIFNSKKGLQAQRLAYRVIQCCRTGLAYTQSQFPRLESVDKLVHEFFFKGLFVASSESSRRQVPQIIGQVYQTFSLSSLAVKESQFVHGTLLFWLEATTQGKHKSFVQTPIGRR